MTTALSDQGLQFATGNIVDMRASYPTTGTYTAGDIVLESTTAARLSGWKRLTSGSSNALGTDWQYFTTLTLATTVATTSGTAIDFTSIPSWVKRITLMFNGVSTNGTSINQVQLGAGSVTATGYSSSGTYTASTTNIGAATSTTGMLVGAGNSASNLIYGQYIFTLVGSNVWVGGCSGGVGPGGVSFTGGGSVTLSGTLDRLRLTTVNGTDTFDAGSVNILYEG